jgi:hypothetical protein
MFKKRLMIGLLAVGLAVIWASEADARTSRRERSVGVYFEFFSVTNLNGDYWATGVHGLEAETCSPYSTRCGEIRGTLYCAEDNTYAAKSACYAESGVDRALVAVLDPDAIPKSFTPEDHNFPFKEQGQRLELLDFVENGPPVNTDYETVLPAGTKKNRAGWHFIDNPLFDLESYRGNWDGALGKFIPAGGYGINGEEHLQGVSLESKYGADLGAAIDGKIICAFWHHDQVQWQGDSLQGNYYGISAFYASYDSVSNTVIARYMDSKEVCGGQLYNDVNAGVAESDSYQCQFKEDVVFAPAPYTSGGITLEVDAFPEVVETITCDPVVDPVLGDGYNCWGVAEINLDPVTGQDRCEKHFKDDYPDISFVDFIPINNECGKAFQGYVDYYGICNPENPSCTPIPLTDVTDNVYCSEEVVAGGGSGAFLYYDCIDTLNPPADCVGLGQSPWAAGEAATCPE